MIFPISLSCVSHMPMIIFIWHSCDARRYKLIEIGIWPFISKSQQPATFQCQGINTLRPRQNGRHFQDDIFKCIFSNENVWISLKNSMKVLPKVRIYNVPALVQIMYCRRPGDKPLSETMMVSLLTHTCVTRPQWVKSNGNAYFAMLKSLSSSFLLTWVNTGMNTISPFWNTKSLCCGRSYEYPGGRICFQTLSNSDRISFLPKPDIAPSHEHRIILAPRPASHWFRRS